MIQPKTLCRKGTINSNKWNNRIIINIIRNNKDINKYVGIPLYNRKRRDETTCLVERENITDGNGECERGCGNSLWVVTSNNCFGCFEILPFGLVAVGV